MRNLLIALVLGGCGVVFAQTGGVPSAGHLWVGSSTDSILGSTNVVMTNANCTITAPSGCTVTGSLGGTTDAPYLGSLYVTSSATLTATRNVVVPLSPGRTYIVTNATTGGQSIQVIGASGSGVPVPSGTTLSVSTPNGTNYVLDSYTIPPAYCAGYLCASQVNVPFTTASYIALSASALSTDTSFTVGSTTGYPALGCAAIPDSTTAYEAFCWDAIDATHLLNLHRGMFGTSAVAHASGSTVQGWIASSSISTSTTPAYVITNASAVVYQGVANGTISSIVASGAAQFNGLFSPYVALTDATQPRVRYTFTTAPSNQKTWYESLNSSGTYLLQTMDDSLAVGQTAVQISRSGTTLTGMLLGQPVAIGSTLLSGPGTARRLEISDSTLPQHILSNTGAASTYRNWIESVNTSGTWSLRTADDSGNPSNTVIAANRTGTTTNLVTFGPAISWGSTPATQIPSSGSVCFNNGTNYVGCPFTLGGSVSSSNCAAGSPAGTGASCSMTGTDGNHLLTVNTGTGPTTGTLVTVTFTTSRGHNTYCTMTPAASVSAIDTSKYINVGGSATSYSISFPVTAISDSVSYSWNVFCP